MRGADGGSAAFEGDDAAPVRIFVMGENRWREERDWPLARAREQRWFLHGGDGGTGTPAALKTGTVGSSRPRRRARSRRMSTPMTRTIRRRRSAVPTSLPGGLLRTNSGPLDQRKLETRADVLLYSSHPLERPLEITGPLGLVLYAATTAPDTDFIGKLCDVAPDGSSRILAEGVLRARYRNGCEVAQLLEPGEVCRYEIDLVATSNVFLAGTASACCHQQLVSALRPQRKQRSRARQRRRGRHGQRTPDDLPR